MSERYRSDPPRSTTLMLSSLRKARWFPRSEKTPPTSQTSPAPALGAREEKRASFLASLATRLMAGLLSNPSRQVVPEQAAEAMVKVAQRIEQSSREAVEKPNKGASPAHVSLDPSPQATAWQAGYRDGDAGLPFSFKGPKELEGDYWDGMNVAYSDGRRRSAND